MHGLSLLQSLRVILPAEELGLGAHLSDVATAHQAPAGAVAATTAVGLASDSPVRAWIGAKIPELVHSPDLLRLHTRWMALIGNKLPRLNELLGAEQDSVLKDSMLLLCLLNDFTFIHHGPSAVKMIGTNLTGILLSERNTAIARAVQKVYLKCVALAEPFYVRHVASNASNQHFFLEQIVLPLAVDERREVGCVLVYNAPLDDKNDVLKAVFERSQIGMIAASSTHDDTGRLQDGRILLINARARAILKLPESMDRIQTVRDLGPWFRDGALWTKTNVATERNLTHIHYRDRSSGVSYRVTIEPIERFVLFSIIEIPAIQ